MSCNLVWSGIKSSKTWRLWACPCTSPTHPLVPTQPKKTTAAAEGGKTSGPLRNLNLAKSQALTDAGMQALLRVCFSLEKLFLGKTALLTDATFATMAVACPNLQVLNVRAPAPLTFIVVTAAAPRTSHTTHRLGQLKGSTCKFGGEGLVAMGTTCTLLAELCLSGCKHLDKPTLLKLLATCPKLEVLEVAGLRLVDDDVLRGVAKRFVRVLRGHTSLNNRSRPPTYLSP